MPRKKGLDVATIVIYIIIAVVFLKLFRIIPDPPEFDINVVTGLLSLAIAILTGIASWLSGRFSKIDDAIESLTKNIQTLSTNMLLTEQKVKNIESSLSFHERLVKLEESIRKEKK